MKNKNQELIEAIDDLLRRIDEAMKDNVKDYENEYDRIQMEYSTH